MKFTNNDQVAAFNEAVAACRNSVWLVSDNGTWYNMKSESEKAEGMSRMEKEDGMELFAATYDDEMTMMKFYRTYMMAA